VINKGCFDEEISVGGCHRVRRLVRAIVCSSRSDYFSVYHTSSPSRFSGRRSKGFALPYLERRLGMRLAPPLSPGFVPLAEKLKA
jgi:hypothetical protein